MRIRFNQKIFFVAKIHEKYVNKYKINSWR